MSFVKYATDSVAIDTSWRLDMKFICNQQTLSSCSVLSALEQTNGHLNYYLPHTGAGLTNIKGYQRIVYENAWPNIDFHLYSNLVDFKFYIVVKPGGNPQDILFHFEGHDFINNTNPGYMEMFMGNESFAFPQAFAWQDNNTVPTALNWLPLWQHIGGDSVNITSRTLTRI